MENISAFWIYVLAMLPDIKAALDFSNGVGFMVFIGIVACMACGLTVAFSISDGEGKAPELLKKYVPYKTYLVILAIFSVLTFASNFIPNYKQAAIIIGGTWAVNNENVQQLPDEIASAVNRLVQSVGTEEEAEKVEN